MRLNALKILLATTLAVSAVTPALAVDVDVDNTVSGYAGADIGSWGGQKGAVIGPPDGTCAAMGAVGKLNMVSNFGFSVPGAGTITGVTAYAKASEGTEQTIRVQLAADADTNPPTNLLGTERDFIVPGTGNNCANTTISILNGGLGDWGLTLGELTPATVNNPAFGMMLKKIETSNVKIDSICLEIAYTTVDGQAVQESCFAPPPSNSITVTKNVVGPDPTSSGWEYAGTGTGMPSTFILLPQGGFETFEVEPGSYSITETTQPGYDVSVVCTTSGGTVSTGGASVSLTLGEGESANCIFTNTYSTGTFNVLKDFSDDSSASVVMTLTCSTGAVSPTTAPASEGDPAIFTVSGFDAGATCKATEAATPGYTQDDSDCQTDGLSAVEGTCTMVNTLNEGTFTVNKDFSDDSAASVDMTLTCSTGTVTTNPVSASEATPAVFEVTGFEAGATCTAKEAPTPGYTQDDSGCQTDGLSAVDGDCTMINTFIVVPPAANIPANSTWALLLLALMMLATGLYFRPNMRKF